MAAAFGSAVFVGRLMIVAGGAGTPKNAEMPREKNASSRMPIAFPSDTMYEKPRTTLDLGTDSMAVVSG